MGLFDSLFGRRDAEPRRDYRRDDGYPPVTRMTGPANADEQAVARYRYMLQSAPPEDVERAHEEAFARLTPQQRQMVLQQLAQEVSDAERARLHDDPRSLARAATRAEIRQPGTMERMFGGNQGQGGMGGGMGGMGGLGMGGMLAGSMLASIAGGMIGSSIAHSFFGNPQNEQGFMQSDAAQNIEGGADSYDNLAQGLETNVAPDPYGDPADVQNADYGGDPYGDPADGGFTDAGYDGGDFGGDFGGGEF